MKNKLIIFFGLILAIILETSFFPSVFSARSAPNLVLIILVSAVIIFGFDKVWIWSIIAGFIFDIFFYNRIGIGVVGFILLCYAVSFSSRRLILGEKIGGVMVGFFLVLFVTFFFNLWIFLVDSGFSMEVLWTTKFYFLGDLGWKIVFNLILFVVFLLFLKQWENKNTFSKKLA